MSYSPIVGAINKLSHVREDIQRARKHWPALANVAEDLLVFVVRDFETLQHWMEEPRHPAPYYFASGVEWLEYIQTQLEALNFLVNRLVSDYDAGDDLVNDIVHTQLPEIMAVLTNVRDD